MLKCRSDFNHKRFELRPKSFILALLLLLQAVSFNASASLTCLQVLSSVSSGQITPQSFFLKHISRSEAVNALKLINNNLLDYSVDLSDENFFRDRSLKRLGYKDTMYMFFKLHELAINKNSSEAKREVKNYLKRFLESQIFIEMTGLRDDWVSVVTLYSDLDPMLALDLMLELNGENHVYKPYPKDHLFSDAVTFNISNYIDAVIRYTDDYKKVYFNLEKFLALLFSVKNNRTLNFRLSKVFFSLYESPLAFQSWLRSLEDGTTISLNSVSLSLLTISHTQSQLEKTVSILNYMNIKLKLSSSSLGDKRAIEGRLERDDKLIFLLKNYRHLQFNNFLDSSEIVESCAALSSYYNQKMCLKLVIKALTKTKRISKTDYFLILSRIIKWSSFSYDKILLYSYARDEVPIMFPRISARKESSSFSKFKSSSFRPYSKEYFISVMAVLKSIDFKTFEIDYSFVSSEIERFNRTSLEFVEVRDELSLYLSELSAIELRVLAQHIEQYHLFKVKTEEGESLPSKDTELYLNGSGLLHILASLETVKDEPEISEASERAGLLGYNFSFGHDPLEEAHLIKYRGFQSELTLLNLQDKLNRVREEWRMTTSNNSTPLEALEFFLKIQSLYNRLILLLAFEGDDHRSSDEVRLLVHSMWDFYSLIVQNDKGDPEESFMNSGAYLQMKIDLGRKLALLL